MFKQATYKKHGGQLRIISTAVLVSTVFLTGAVAHAQFNCDKSVKVIDKQMKKIKNVATKTADQWIEQYKDTLHLTYDLKKGKFLFDPWEQLFWYRVDSVLCEKSPNISTDSLFTEMKKNDVLVYSITWTFKNPDKTEGEVRLCFNIFGQWTFAEYRPNSWGKSETWRHYWNKASAR